MTEHSDHPFETEPPQIAGAPDSSSPTSSVRLDVSRYLHMIDDPALSDDQKRQMLEALWSIMVAFVDLGFGIHPVQQACGKVESRLASEPGTDSDSSNQFGNTLSQAFNNAAAPHGRRKRKTP